MARKVRREAIGVRLVRLHGWGTATRGLSFLCMWTMWVAAHDGEAPSAEVLASGSDRSRATMFRSQQAFRKCFPNEVNPDRIARVLLKRRGIDFSTAATVFVLSADVFEPAAA